MMGKRIRVLLLAGAVTCLGILTYKVVGILFLQQARELQRNPVRLLNYVPEAALQLKEFRHVIVEDGRKVWEVTGQEARYFKDEEHAVVKEPRVVFYHNGGAPSEGRANEGTIFFTEKDVNKIQLKGQIRFNYQGLALATDEMLYLASQDQVVAPGKVTIEWEGMELEGARMEIDLGEEKIWFRDKVRTKIQPGKVSRIRSVRSGRETR